MQVTEKRYYSIEEYLALEEKADSRSEYIDGEIIPMAGGSANHNRIAGNFYAVMNLRSSEKIMKYSTAICVFGYRSHVFIHTQM